jgi:two-component system KDP operon response regulator KdpE
MNGREALDAASRDRPDLVVLDLGLPDMDGVDVLRALRGWTTVPVLILSGRTQGLAKVQALDAGADDYVTKPFNVDELVARLRAVGRRAATNDDDEQPIVRIGETTVDLQSHIVTTRRGGEAGEKTVIRLTKTEWQLLSVLVRNPGRLVTQRELMLDVRGPDFDDADYLRQFMAQLRRKLEPNPARPRYLLTEPGMGYRFQP